MNENILITGGCGFVGSNIAINLKSDFPGARIIAFDNLKRRGSELNMARLVSSGVEFIHGDVRNKEDFDKAGEVSVIIDAAAEPSVLSGINSAPDYIINSNFSGTINTLNFALRNNAKFIFMSTSRVYPINKLNNILYTEQPSRFAIDKYQSLAGVSVKGINESFSLEGARSFYGASKLASEQFIQEYSEFYGLRAVINRCGVITGPWQMGKIDQGVIVLWLSRHYFGKELSYIGYGGTGKQVRDFIHIDDIYRLLKIQINEIDKYNKGIFNVGGGINISTSLSELTLLCQEITGKKIPIRSVSENRIADVPVYVSDNSKINSLSGWSPTKLPGEILNNIFNWIRKNENTLKDILN